MNDQPPFDVMSLRLDQSFVEGSAVKQVLSIIPLDKPNSQDFFRVHPGEDYRLSPTGVIELKDEREKYIVAPSLAEELRSEMTPCMLLTTVNRQRVVRLWPAKLAMKDGRSSAWHTSALQAANIAQERWVRLQANQSLGAYEIHEALAPIPEPEWPALTFNQLFEIAVVKPGRLIASLDHPVVKRLRGLA
jgi:hypothetical protein